MINIASKVSTSTFIFPKILQLQGKRNVCDWIPRIIFYHFILIKGLGLNRKADSEYV